MALNKLNVLYIEDPLAQNDGAEELLEELFHECIRTDSFLDSVSAIKNVHVDFIVANTANPELEALKFIRLVKSKLSDFPVVAVGKMDEEEQKKLQIDLVISGAEPRKLKEAVKKLEEATLELADRRNRLKKNLERSLDADEAIQVYFRKTITELAKYDHEVPEHKKMDHSIMRPFLTTAYNNLKEMDHRLEDDRLKEARIRMERAEKIKRDFTTKSSSTIQESYHVIFLSVQIPYVTMEGRYGDLRDSIFRLGGEHQMLERKVKTLKKRLLTMAEGDEGYQTLLENIKKLNRRDVDTVHKINEDRRKIENLQNEMEAFRERHFDLFETAYRTKVDALKGEITDTLNNLCYQFDRELWRRARQSGPIRTFLKEARVQGLFSSRTYLKYYTQKIDEKIAGKQLLRITKYVEEYNNKNKIRFAVLSTETERVAKSKEALEQIDRSIKVYGFTNPRQAIDKYRVYQYDYLLMDFDMGREDGFSVLREFYDRYRKTPPETTVCLRMPLQYRSRFAPSLEQCRVSHVFDTSLSTGDLQEKIMEIL